ncbi:MAG: pore-forming ESAT-6 family protein [Propionibacteriales bacterium]|nr:pore-forming ESAT-6 family protein [Propionibacteriales bacterium]
MVHAGPGDRAYNTASSAEAQRNFNSIANQLESLLNLRDRQVKAAMAQYHATGVSDEYHGKERRWNSKAQQVRTIIRLLRQSLGQNDQTAITAVKRAGTAVANIG